jgi:hypothetical protein
MWASRPLVGLEKLMDGEVLLRGLALGFVRLGVFVGVLAQHQAA